ncbi:hypothetical protein [Staphylococcus capitis]|jgi:hypothetical protein|uniref:hypothetical protein n=1 Tax=Staphylococcus capitis TaxID=29388 RepID=UPI0037D14F0C
MKKKIVGTITGAVLLSSLAATLPENPVSSLNPSLKHEAKAKEGKVIAKRTISKKDVKQIASTSKKRAKNIKTWGPWMASVLGKWGIPVSGATLASTQAAERNLKAFQTAAKQNKRVQVIVKSGPTPNLNSVSYKVVK